MRNTRRHDFESVGTIARRVLAGIRATVGCGTPEIERLCEPLADDGRGRDEAGGVWTPHDLAAFNAGTSR